MIGVSDATDPSAPLGLDFLTNPDGSYLRVELDGIAMDGYNVPVAGISLDGAMYVAVKTNYTPGQQTSVTLLTRYDEATHHFTVLRELTHAQRPLHHADDARSSPGLTGLPADPLRPSSSARASTAAATHTSWPCRSIRSRPAKAPCTTRARASMANWSDMPWAAVRS